MRIKNLVVSNFKSIEHAEINFEMLSILIGANASGKSNFVHALQFLRDIANHGLNDAISLQGGIEYLRNTRIGSSRDLAIKLVAEQEISVTLFSPTKLDRILVARSSELTYEFALKFTGNKGYNVASDTLTLKCRFDEMRLDNPSKTNQVGEGYFRVINKGGSVNYEVESTSDELLNEDFTVFPYVQTLTRSTKFLLLEEDFIIPAAIQQPNVIRDIAIYDFDPKASKQAIPVVGKRELQEDGENLALVLKSIVEDKNKKRRLANLLGDILPFVEDVNVAKFADRSLMFEMKEQYSHNHYLPAFLMSDGTINITALVVALYFESKSLILVEEPERNIHPYLISRVVDMLKEVSHERQVIITTQNPEIVKYADLESIFLVTRDNNGFSVICKPSEKQSVRSFLNNEIGFEELYVRDLLGAV